MMKKSLLAALAVSGAFASNASWGGTVPAVAPKDVQSGGVDLSKAFEKPEGVRALSDSEMKTTRGAGQCMTFFFNNGGQLQVSQYCW